MKPFNKYFDHTLLKPDASADEISKVAREALEYDFCSVCVAGCRVPYVKRLLEGSNIKTACVTGFPLGSATVSAKAFETEEAIKNGADEIDTVINIGLVKEGRFDDLGDEIKIISDICHKSEVVLKTIIETCLLTEEEIAKVCRIAESAGTDYIKTSTGFSTGGARPEDIMLMRASAPSVSIKASGGIRTLDDAVAMINAGADRLGCSSSVSIMNEYFMKNSRI